MGGVVGWVGTTDPFVSLPPLPPALSFPMSLLHRRTSGQSWYSRPRSILLLSLQEEAPEDGVGGLKVSGVYAHTTCRAGAVRPFRNEHHHRISCREGEGSREK